MKKNLDKIVAGAMILGLGVGAFLYQKEQTMLRYNPEWIDTHCVQKVYVDADMSQSITTGDRAVFFYDMNNDGMPDYKSSHWVRGLREDGTLDFWEMPYQVMIDYDHDGKFDVVLDGFNSEGLPNSGDKIVKPARPQLTEVSP